MPNVYPAQGIETRLVREDTYGTTPGAPSYKRLNGFGVVLGATVEIETFAPPGALVPTIPLVNDDYSEGDVSGRVDFNGLAYVLSGLFGPATVTSLGGGPAAYSWVWTWNGRKPNRPVSYTIHSGFYDSADIATGFLFNTLDISGGREDGFEISGEGLARALTAGNPLGGVASEAQLITKTATVTGGTFTITVAEVNETTAAIPYDATAAVVQAALEALPSVDAGDIVCTAGPISTTPMTLTYGGQFAGRNVAQCTVNSGTLIGGGSYTPTTTTPGTDTVVDVPAVPAGAVFGNVYLDQTWAGLGVTQLLYAYEMDLSIGERMGRIRPINKSKSSDSVVDVADQEHTLALTLGRNAVADAQLAKLRAGTRVFPRVEWIGDVISGANSYTFQIDSCLIYSEVGMPDNVQDASTREFTGRMAIDPVSGNVISCKLINALPSL